MIWDVINAFIATTLTVTHGIFGLLPQSPVYIPSDVVTAITPLLHTAAWYWPVSGSITFLAGYIVAVGILITVLLLKQLIEAAIP